MTMAMIFAVAHNDVIGADSGEQLWHLSADLRRFYRLTVGHPVIMGRKTFAAIGHPLPGRTNIVLTRRSDFEKSKGVIVCSSVSQALATARAIDEQYFVIGGADIFRQALPFADLLYVTYIRAYPEGEVVFNFKPEEWEEVARAEVPQTTGDSVTGIFCDYRRRL